MHCMLQTNQSPNAVDCLVATLRQWHDFEGQRIPLTHGRTPLFITNHHSIHYNSHDKSLHACPAQPILLCLRVRVYARAFPGWIGPSVSVYTKLLGTNEPVCSGGIGRFCQTICADIPYHLFRLYQVIIIVVRRQNGTERPLLTAASAPGLLATIERIYKLGRAWAYWDGK